MTPRGRAFFVALPMLMIGLPVMPLGAQDQPRREIAGPEAAARRAIGLGSPTDTSRHPTMGRSQMGQTQDVRPADGIARPTPPTPPQVTAPQMTTPRARENAGQNPSIFRAVEGQNTRVRSNAGGIPQGASGNNAGGPGNSSTPAASTPANASGQPGQVRPREAIRPDMNAIHREPASLRPAPPSYRPPPPGVVHNPPSGRQPPPILRQQPGATGKVTAPRSTAATAPPPQQPAAIPPGFRPVPPRAPAFRVMPGMQGPRRPTPPGGPAAAAGPKPQQFECTPERVAARMCR